MRYEKVRQIEALSLNARAVLNTTAEENILEVSGINGEPLVEPLPNYARAQCEKVIEGQNNTYIVLGRDRPSTLMSGYGGKGHTSCGTIDIVAGRGMPFIRSQTYPGGAPSPIKTNPSPFFDASKIYISQKTDIDANFRLADGTVGISRGKAAIAIKSDAVRILAREGIKIVTGVDRINSRGAELISVGGIDLIAGNNDKGLEPLVKGHTLRKALTELSDRINELNGVVDSFLTYQLQYNAVLMKHTHPDAINIAIGMLAADNPKALTDGSTLQSPAVMGAGKKNIVCLNTISKKDLVSNKLNLTKWKFKFLQPGSPKYINSNYNNTN
jgi:hypothetical protein